ncbi:hypothetical protein [Paraburkholderia sp. UCT2]|uniref:hypothetical protein n=1 Tax=Paraburkholderia sp. UCT2 TaxID=2615208 RepID=UPI0016564833|nr:hypothetical protein [Paraburkholderia sp. UCT2]MBC8727432.1 hypothetical protein [Paraburkholderia sp. UCT2]
MNAVLQLSDRDRYARCIRASKMVSWDIDRDVIGGRTFDMSQKYLPDGLSLVPDFIMLSEAEKRFVSQIQGRTYANVFGLVERFINAKVLEVSRDYWLGDQVALEALVRFSDEELKHQALFRRIEKMIGETLPAGYHFDVDADALAAVVLGKSTWAVLAMTLHIELFSQIHYRQSIHPDDQLSELFKDVFLYHWKEESQHAILDELEWKRHDATLTDAARDNAVNEFIDLMIAIDGILRGQATADSRYFIANCGRAVVEAEAMSIEANFHHAYRWQYLHSGMHHPHFAEVLDRLVSEEQGMRIRAALATLH